VVNGQFTVKFDSMVPGPAGKPFTNSTIQFGKWTLTDNTSGKVYRSDTTTVYPYEQLFLDLGLALTINQVSNPGDTLSDGTVTDINGLLWAPSAIYADSTKIWLSGIPDNDIPASPFNWIRSGTYKSAEAKFNDWDMNAGKSRPWDPNKNYQKIQRGTWAPYALTASKDQNPMGPAFDLSSKRYASLDNVGSVDIVFTSDKSLWTRCVVIEMCPDSLVAENRGESFYYRKTPSVNAYGEAGKESSNPLENSNYISSTGMGWFPGYAINLETGERLNMMFGENSWLVADNGRDMLWNPSSRVADASGNPVFGGMHYVYVMSHRSFSISNSSIKLNFPAYDGGAYIRSTFDAPLKKALRPYVYGSAMYTGIPLSVPGKEWLSNQVSIYIRVSKPYQRYYSAPLPAGSIDTTNRNYPVYVFNTSSISTSKDNAEKATTDLDLINVVPNPYYAYDDYERNQLDNRIKIVNLPTRCTVTIFDISGTMIRQFVVDKSGIPQPRSSNAGLNTDSKTSLDWDLKNFAGIPIAGGVYLIHVNADGLGERTLKWFGILRPVDLNSL
jgi:hypothetical protein